MATGPKYNVAFKRRRKNQTNYVKRLALIKNKNPRMVIRKSGRGIVVQFIEFSSKGDKVICGINSSSLKKFGWMPKRNSPTAYLCGLFAGKQALKKGIKEFNLDIGMNVPTKGAIIFSALRGDCVS